MEFSRNRIEKCEEPCSIGEERKTRSSDSPKCNYQQKIYEARRAWEEIEFKSMMKSKILVCMI